MVLEGSVTFEFKTGPKVAETGALIWCPHGTPFAWRNDSDQPARVLFIYAPGGFEEFFSGPPGCHTGRVHQRRGISRKYAADSIPGGAGRAYFCQHLACQAWVVAAGGRPRKGEEQGYGERFRHCSIYGC